MADILEEIVAHKRIEIEQRKRFIQPRQMITLTEQKMQEDGGKVPGGSMKESLMNSETGIIAEFKRKSPSKGWIKQEGKPSIIPLAYQQNGASALSILTDIDYFGGYDEISLTGDFKVTTNNYEKIFKPQDLGFEIAKPEEVRGGATEEEAKDIFDAVIENRALPAQKNIVLANAAFGIQVMEKGQKSIEECVEIARESIDSGKALATFKKFVEINS